ncbi:MAG TPA: MarR family transcriptional regulator [Microbacterium sp.]|uniref:MarR family winged helix-turn-helix transcriptional regulator n=1 Tax=Microbacterium sp. TaxID=51671 RepID=UPI002CC7BF36|nr:MarR family transcriptional regulator [Microbacterium sp.]HWI29870.1 MarR family transcriptional regulator [Microbacterium sp.]
MTASSPDDEVDLLIDAWSRRLPDVDFGPLDVMSRLRRVAIRLRALRAEAFRSAGLESWEFDVLAALRRADPPHQLSPTELVDRTMIGSAAMTNRLVRLSDRGLIERHPNTRDRRGVIVGLTAEGGNRVDAAMRELVRREAAELEGLSGEDLAHLERVLRKLLGAAN